jgi:hypothetical protein
MAANHLWVVIATAAALAPCLALGCANRDSAEETAGERRSESPTAPAFEVVTLALREDYEKGDDLGDVAKDFELMNELGVYEVQFNINWDTYEPERGRYDLEWLHGFVGLAAQHNIKLRPYICYSPGWAAEAWNSPPRELGDWREFCLALGKAMRRHPNILSYEIWMEQNSDMWWTGSIEEYGALFRQAAEALRSTDPDCQILFGGLTFPNHQWLDVFADGATDCGDAVLLHCFHESWGPPGVPIEDSLDSLYTDLFLPVVDSRVPGRPIWMSECGYSTWNRSEEDQANFIARAVPHFLANTAGGHRFTRFTYYETKDLPEGSPMIGDDHNYHFGLCRADRTKKLSFHTYAMLAKLLNGQAVAPADDEVTVTATEGAFGKQYHHLFKRADGVQVLFLYEKEKALTAAATLTTPGTKCMKWNLDGTSRAYPEFDGSTISGIRLRPGEVCVFEVR